MISRLFGGPLDGLQFEPSQESRIWRLKGRTVSGSPIIEGDPIIGVAAGAEHPWSNFLGGKFMIKSGNSLSIPPTCSIVVLDFSKPPPEPRNCYVIEKTEGNVSTYRWRP